MKKKWLCDCEKCGTELYAWGQESFEDYDTNAYWSSGIDGYGFRVCEDCYWEIENGQADDWLDEQFESAELAWEGF